MAEHPYPENEMTDVIDWAALQMMRDDPKDFRAPGVPRKPNVQEVVKQMMATNGIAGYFEEGTKLKEIARYIQGIKPESVKREFIENYVAKM